MVVVLKLSGLTHRVKTHEVREFFRGLRLKDEDVHIAPDKGNRNANTIFVVFHNDDDARKASARNGKMIGTRRVDVALSSMSEMEEALKGDTGRSIPSRGGFGRGRGMTTFRGRGRGARGRGHFGPSREDRSDRDFDSRVRGVGPRRGRGGPGRPQFENRNSLSGNPGRSMNRPEPPRESSRKDFQSPPNRSDKRLSRDNRDLRGSAKKTDGSDVSDRRFVKLTGVPYNVKETEIQNFFRGLRTREIFFRKHPGGKFVGRPNGEIIIEFFTEKDTREALERDGKRFGSRSAVVTRPQKEEILEVLQGKTSGKRETNPIGSPIIPPITGNSPAQIKNLLQVLSTALAGLTPGLDKEQSHRERGNVHQDPVIRRVARNANIDIEDINASKVVGIRNLPFTITPEDVIDFFRGYGAIPDSVRIHYMGDGRSSGDAIITFRTSRDANRAVESLNKRPVGRQQVELFLL